MQVGTVPCPCQSAEPHLRGWGCGRLTGGCTGYLSGWMGGGCPWLCLQCSRHVNAAVGPSQMGTRRPEASVSSGPPPATSLLPPHPVGPFLCDSVHTAPQWGTGAPQPSSARRLATCWLLFPSKAPGFCVHPSIVSGPGTLEPGHCGCAPSSLTTQSRVHSFTHSFTHSSLIHSPSYSLSHSLIHHSFTHSFSHSSLIHSFIHPLIHSLIHHSLIHSFIHSLSNSFTHSPYHSFLLHRGLGSLCLPSPTISSASIL